MCENDYINSIRNEIRGYMVMRGQTYKTVAEKLRKKFGENVNYLDDSGILVGSNGKTLLL